MKQIKETGKLPKAGKRARPEAFPKAGKEEYDGRRKLTGAVFPGSRRTQKPGRRRNGRGADHEVKGPDHLGKCIYAVQFSELSDCGSSGRSGSVFQYAFYLHYHPEYCDWNFSGTEGQEAGGRAFDPEPAFGPDKKRRPGSESRSWRAGERGSDASGKRRSDLQRRGDRGGFA